MPMSSALGISGPAAPPFDGPHGYGGFADDSRKRVSPLSYSVVEKNRKTVFHPPADEPSLTSDEELIHALAEGDRDAMTTLFARYRRLVHSIAFRIVRDREEAEDVVQTVFFDIFRAADQFDPGKGTIKIWLLQYAYHRALHRKRHLVANRFYEWENLDFVSRELSGTHKNMPDLILFVGQVLECLNPRQRSVISLTYYEGLTAEEISDRLCQSVHVVRHDLRRALTAMRKSIGVLTRRNTAASMEPCPEVP